MAIEDLGHIVCKDGHMEYTSDTYSSWCIPVEELAVLGEFVDESGPFCEDHFLVFVTRDATWVEAPVGARGMDVAMKELGRMLNADCECRMSRAAFGSGVIWPDTLAGAKLFTIRLSDDDAPKWWDLRFWVPEKVIVTLTPGVQAWIEEACSTD